MLRIYNFLDFINKDVTEGDISLSAKTIFSEKLDEQLVNDGWYKWSLKPRFYDGNDTIKCLGEPCFRNEFTSPLYSRDYIRFFVNKTELYIEVQDFCGSYRTSEHYLFEEDETVTLESINNIINVILNSAGLLSY